MVIKERLSLENHKVSINFEEKLQQMLQVPSHKSSKIIHLGYQAGMWLPGREVETDGAKTWLKIKTKRKPESSCYRATASAQEAEAVKAIRFL